MRNPPSVRARRTSSAPLSLFSPSLKCSRSKIKLWFAQIKNTSLWVLCLFLMRVCVKVFWDHICSCIFVVLHIKKWKVVILKLNKVYYRNILWSISRLHLQRFSGHPAAMHESVKRVIGTWKEKWIIPVAEKEGKYILATVAVAFNAVSHLCPAGTSIQRSLAWQQQKVRFSTMEKARIRIPL